jgi:hypothetical protein
MRKGLLHRDVVLPGARWSKGFGSSAVPSKRAVQIAGGPTLVSVLDFHTWAYLRYKLLEEGYDSWIGDDES